MKRVPQLHGSAASSAELKKHSNNDAKCRDCDWVCVPMAGDTYGAWGHEAQTTFSHLATPLAINDNLNKITGSLQFV